MPLSDVTTRKVMPADKTQRLFDGAADTSKVGARTIYQARDGLGCIRRNSTGACTPVACMRG